MENHRFVKILNRLFSGSWNVENLFFEEPGIVNYAIIGHLFVFFYKINIQFSWKNFFEVRIRFV